MTRLFGKSLRQATNEQAVLAVDQKALLQQLADAGDPLKDALTAGRLFIGGASIALGGTLSSERAAMRLFNPAASGRIVKVVLATIYSSTEQQVRYRIGATLSGATTVAAGSILQPNLGITNSAPSAQLSHTVTEPTTGTLLSNQSRVGPSEALNLQLPPLVLPPGQSLVIMGTSGAAQTFTANAYWIESDL